MNLESAAHIAWHSSSLSAVCTSFFARIWGVGVAEDTLRSLPGTGNKSQRSVKRVFSIGTSILLHSSVMKRLFQRGRAMTTAGSMP